ncbi:MAG: glycosyltransferase family 9 protein [Bdellovibrionota bacterium]
MTDAVIDKNQEALRILVVRPDRLGDVVLSTPVLEVIKRHYPRSKVTAMVREPVAPIIRGLSSVDDMILFDPDGRHSGVRGFVRLVRAFRKRHFKIAIVLQTHRRIALALFLAGVRYRVGPLSKLHSFLFYNRGIRQHRSQVEMHETDYNLQLLRRLGIRVGTRNVATKIHVPDESRAWAKSWLVGQGWNPGTPLVIVHPGMGGSALNWPDTHYQEFIRALIREGRQVLITAGPTEGLILEKMRTALGPMMGSKVMYYGGKDAGAIDYLAGLISWTSLLVAPSTGPLHIAVALGKPVVSFYPPIRVQSAIRWGPYIQDEVRASVLSPEVYCGEDFTCRGNLCNYYPCMRGLTVTQAIEQANRHLALAQAELEAVSKVPADV